MDLITLDMNTPANAGAWVDITHPTGHQPIGLRIKVFGRDSDKFQAEIERQDRTYSKPARPDLVDEKVARQRRIELLTACTAAWQHRADDAKPGDWTDGLLLGGKVLPCTAENARKVFEHPGMRWLVDQIDVAIADRSLFLKAA